MVYPMPHCMSHCNFRLRATAHLALGAIPLLLSSMGCAASFADNKVSRFAEETQAISDPGGFRRSPPFDIVDGYLSLMLEGRLEPVGEWSTPTDAQASVANSLGINVANAGVKSYLYRSPAGIARNIMAVRHDDPPNLLERTSFGLSVATLSAVPAVSCRDHKFDFIIGGGTSSKRSYRYENNVTLVVWMLALFLVPLADDMEGFGDPPPLFFPLVDRVRLDIFLRFVQDLDREMATSSSTNPGVGSQNSSGVPRFAE
jgi:hypothetical protein